MSTIFDPEDNVKAAERIRSLLCKFPSLRVMQLLGNAIPSEYMEKCGEDPYYLPDATLLQFLDQYEEKVREAAIEAASRRKIDGTGRKGGVGYNPPPAVDNPPDAPPEPTED